MMRRELDGERGNPVVRSCRLFPDLMVAEGNVDTPEALEAVRAELERT
jgi:CTP:molybdopterin cytidylyltransferase MocA